MTGDAVGTAMGQLGAIYAMDAYDLDVMSKIGKSAIVSPNSSFKNYACMV